MKTGINRRTFVRRSAAFSAGVVAAMAGPAVARSSDSPARRLRVAVMGVNGQGMAHIKGWMAQPGVEVAAICDVDSRAVAKAIKAVALVTGREPTAAVDIRRILEDRDIDAISIATPNHWHAPATILACAAGKHVYVEKPGSHNPREAELMVAAARRYRRCVQMGNQRRSMRGIIQAIEALRGGVIGRILAARCYYTRFRPSIGRGREVPVPEWLDYALWQGPAPVRPYRDNVIHYNWHWFWHWGNGEMGNNAVHTLDLARWAMGVDRPRRVTFGGGRYLVEDDQETPDTGVAAFDFGTSLITWEQSSSHPRAGESLPLVAFYGERGRLVLADGGHKVYDEKGREVAASESGAKADVVAGPGGEAEHFANFCAAVRDGVPLNSEIEEGQKSTMLCHYANMAIRTGRAIDIDPATGKVLNNPDAMALWSREYRPGWEPAV